jgi:hypothetical protein
MSIPVKIDSIWTSDVEEEDCNGRNAITIDHMTILVMRADEKNLVYIKTDWLYTT